MSDDFQILNILFALLGFLFVSPYKLSKLHVFQRYYILRHAGILIIIFLLTVMGNIVRKWGNLFKGGG